MRASFSTCSQLWGLKSPLEIKIMLKTHQYGMKCMKYGATSVIMNVGRISASRITYTREMQDVR